MKKACISLLVFCILFPVNLFSRNISLLDLTPEQIREYNYRRLSYDIQSGFTGNIDSYGSISGSTYKLWVPYEGTRKITEHTFFEIAGYEREAREARQYHSLRLWLLGGGLAVSAVGALMFILAQEGSPVEIGGAVLLIGGSISVSGGALMFMNNRYPSNIADMVIEDYNQRLFSAVRNK